MLNNKERETIGNLSDEELLRELSRRGIQNKKSSSDSKLQCPFCSEDFKKLHDYTEHRRHNKCKKMKRC